jgi:hypothetical protein
MTIIRDPAISTKEAKVLDRVRLLGTPSTLVLEQRQKI